jgi:hypothetical protein
VEIWWMKLCRIHQTISILIFNLSLNTILPFKFDYRSVYSIIKVNFTTFESLKANLLYCTYVRQRQYMRVRRFLNVTTFRIEEKKIENIKIFT